MFKALEDIPLFKGVDNNTLRLLEPLFESFSCPAGTVVFEQGDPAKYLYLILNGAIEVRYKPYDGPPITITNLTNGAIFGWSAVIGNISYTSAAVCKEDCTAIRMCGKELHGFCKREPEAGRIILNILAQSVSNRWQDAQNQIQFLLNNKVIIKGSSNPGRRKEAE